MTERVKKNANYERLTECLDDILNCLDVQVRLVNSSRAQAKEGEERDVQRRPRLRCAYFWVIVSGGFGGWHD